MSDEPMMGVQGIADYMGMGESAAKKWRGNTIAALRRAGQMAAPEPTVRLPRNALPIPDNQREHVRDGVAPRWRKSTIDAWAMRTGRVDLATGKFQGATPTGRPVEAARTPVPA